MACEWVADTQRYSVRLDACAGAGTAEEEAECVRVRVSNLVCDDAALSVGTCASCGAGGAAKRCAACRAVFYCGPACQKAHTEPCSAEPAAEPAAAATFAAGADDGRRVLAGLSVPPVDDPQQWQLRWLRVRRHRGGRLRGGGLGGAGLGGGGGLGGAGLGGGGGLGGFGLGGGGGLGGAGLGGGGLGGGGGDGGGLGASASPITAISASVMA